MRAHVADSDAELQAYCSVSKDVLFALVRDYAKQEVAATGKSALGDQWIKEASKRLEILAANNLVPRRYGGALKAKTRGNISLFRKMD